MPRPVTIDDQTLIGRLTAVFRESGYEGTSLNLLAGATGLRKASLYHRFPRGKEQMATEVLARARAWFDQNIFGLLRGEGTPEERLRAFTQRLGTFYAGGHRPCLLNMLSVPEVGGGVFTAAIGDAFRAWIDSLRVLLMSAGFEEGVARRRAVRAVALVQGSLVMSRGMGDATPFRDALASLERELLVPEAEPRRGT